VKKFKVLVIILCAALLFVTLFSSPAIAEDEETQLVLNYGFGFNTSPLKSDVLYFYPEPGEEVTIVVRTKNTSATAIEEVWYDLSSDQGIGGIRTVIDYDGPFGPLPLEDYNWNKVSIRPGTEQYLYITFPIPATFDPLIDVDIKVIRNNGDRG
jgi:hypothetical protein